MNIAHRIREVSTLYPLKKSVVLARNNSSYTFKEFEEKSNQFAHQFIKMGLKPGMRTILFVKPCLDFSVMTFALFKVGAIPVLIDPGMGMTSLLESVKQVRPQALVSVGMVHWLRRLKKDSFKNLEVKVSLSRVGGSTHYLYSGIENMPKEFTPVKVSSTDCAAILFTSGGTGIPKGVIYTHGILHAQTDVLRDLFCLDQSQIDLPGFPLFALFTLALGMTSVIPELDPSKPAQCHPAKIVKNIMDHKVTFAAGSPSIWERVGKYCLDHNIELPTVKQVVMFGAPVRAEIHQMFKKILTNGDTYTPYGATECLPVSLVSGSEILKNHLPHMLRGYGTCIGRPVPGVKMTILKTSDISEDHLNELPLGEIGEIAVQGKQVTSGYFEMELETKKTKIMHQNELWHRMGDLGHIDREGQLWFLGRKAHRVESLNETYYPMQIESIFNQHPKIKRTALIKLNINGLITPSLVIERHDKNVKMTDSFLRELLVLRDSEEFTKPLHQFFLHPGFPVDVRHNIKIDRIKLSSWAQSQHS